VEKDYGKEIYARIMLCSDSDLTIICVHFLTIDISLL
jgi:hypothetical protein